jgi:hypothetical protein
MTDGKLTGVEIQARRRGTHLEEANLVEAMVEEFPRKEIAMSQDGIFSFIEIEFGRTLEMCANSVSCGPAGSCSD